jgi:copper chaperone CopZ
VIDLIRFSDPNLFGRERMRLSKWLVLPGVCGLMVLCGTVLALAEAKVELKGVHLCCGACVKGVATALKGVEGVSAKCDQDAGTVTITAKDDAAAQKALDALTDAGYHGETGNPAFTIKETAGVPKGKVKSLTLTGVHNCCRSCCKGIKDAVKTVAGVKADTAKPKDATFEVTGDFDAAEVVKALSAAGFHVKVKE